MSESYKPLPGFIPPSVETPSAPVPDAAVSSPTTIGRRVNTESKEEKKPSDTESYEHTQLKKIIEELYLSKKLTSPYTIIEVKAAINNAIEVIKAGEIPPEARQGYIAGGSFLLSALCCFCIPTMIPALAPTTIFCQMGYPITGAGIGAAGTAAGIHSFEAMRLMQISKLHEKLAEIEKLEKFLMLQTGSSLSSTHSILMRPITTEPVTTSSGASMRPTTPTAS